MPTIVTEVCIVVEQGTGGELTPGLFVTQGDAGQVVLSNFSTLAPVQETLTKLSGITTFEYTLNGEQRQALLSALQQ